MLGPNWAFKWRWWSFTVLEFRSVPFNCNLDNKSFNLHECWVNSLGLILPSLGKLKPVASQSCHWYELELPLLLICVYTVVLLNLELLICNKFLAISTVNRRRDTIAIERKVLSHLLIHQIFIKQSEFGKHCAGGILSCRTGKEIAELNYHHMCHVWLPMLKG